MQWESRRELGWDQYTLDFGPYTLFLARWGHDDGFLDSWYLMGLSLDGGQPRWYPKSLTASEAMAQAERSLKSELACLIEKL